MANELDVKAPVVAAAITPVVPPVTAPVAAPVVAPTPVTPAVVVTPTTVVKDTSVVENTAPQVKLSNFQVHINKIKESGTPMEKGLVVALEKYEDKMKPGIPMQADNGARHQYDLWRAIYASVVNSDNESFNGLWNIILMFFAEYEKSSFNISYVFRFAHAWIWGDEEIDTYHKTLNLIRLTAKPSERAMGLKSVDMSRALVGLWPEEARQRINSFYVQ